MSDTHVKLSQALWRIYQRPERPLPWRTGGNLPWDDPDFSQRMLRQHLDETHGAASRTTPERQKQIKWFHSKLGLQSGQHLLDVTCGPGFYAVALAKQGIQVTGIDFGPAAIAHARQQAQAEQVAAQCQFIRQDVRHMQLPDAQFDAALFIYGQLAVFTRQEAEALLTTIAKALKPGGKLIVELLDQERVDKKDSTWWYSDNSGLWGDGPFIHLGERVWHADEQISVERFHILHLETGQMDEIHLCDQTYSTDEMVGMMHSAGFTAVSVHPAQAELPLYDNSEWFYYIARR